MAEARAYQCPVCGAFAQDGERACRHCASLLATLRCGHCFELSFPDALHCRGCGLELGLSPEAEASALKCPDCQVELRAFQAGAGRLLACGRCGGQLVTHGLLRALIEQREALGRAVPSLDAPRGNPLSAPVRYRACPCCGQMMNRKNFGGSSGIVIDVCSLHGTLFDRGELPRVLEFVRRGGLARAQLPQPALTTPLASPLPASSAAEPLSGAKAPLLADGVVELVDFVIDMLTTSTGRR
jgi:Zn-finger nucleic acid-binding protein